MSTLNTGGRPKISDSEKKKEKIYCYLTIHEKEQYNLFLKNNPGTNSFHLKTALFKYIGLENNQPQKINQNVKAALNELNAVSRLENQIAKHLNKGLKLDGSSTIQHMKNQEEIKRVLSQIKNLLIQ